VSTSSVRLQGRHVTKPAARVGATGLTCRRPQCVLLLYLLYQLVKRCCSKTVFSCCNNRHDCEEFTVPVSKCHVGLALRRQDWAAVQTYDWLTFTGSIARSTDSVSLSTLGTDFFTTEKFSEWITETLCCWYGNKSLNFVSWLWASDVHSWQDSWTNNYLLWERITLVHSVRTAC
jgi:hypothetical protein